MFLPCESNCLITTGLISMQRPCCRGRQSRISFLPDLYWTNSNMLLWKNKTANFLWNSLLECMILSNCYYTKGNPFWQSEIVDGLKTRANSSDSDNVPRKKGFSPQNNVPRKKVFFLRREVFSPSVFLLIFLCSFFQIRSAGCCANF